MAEELPFSEVAHIDRMLGSLAFLGYFLKEIVPSEDLVVPQVRGQLLARILAHGLDFSDPLA
jgi:hypothetical protein